MTTDKELDALVERLDSMIAHRPRVLALRDIEVLEQTSDAISALRNELAIYKGREEGKQLVINQLEKERDRLREALRGIYAHTGVSANAMSMAAIDSLLGSIERLCEGALETDHMRKATENDPFCIRNGVADVVNGVNETTLPQIDTNDDCAPCSALAPQEPTTDAAIKEAGHE